MTRQISRATSGATPSLAAQEPLPDGMREAGTDVRSISHERAATKQTARKAAPHPGFDAHRPIRPRSRPEDDVSALRQATQAKEPCVRVSFDAPPAAYRHWRLSFDGVVAIGVAQDAGLQPGYKLKP